MNNLFLLNEALIADNIEDFETGVMKINEIAMSGNACNRIKHESIWEWQTGCGCIVDCYSSAFTKVTQRMLPRILESFKSYETYLRDVDTFDACFPNKNNGFAGIDFSSTSIPSRKQIFDEACLRIFLDTYLRTSLYESVDAFWSNRIKLFPHLVILERVYSHIHQFATSDDRFRQIIIKLEKLENNTKNWISGEYNFSNLGKCSPDTPTKVAETKALRTFDCGDNVGAQVFSWHMKWYVGNQPFRLYFYPNPISHTVYVGYIEGKDGIGY